MKKKMLGVFTIVICFVTIVMSFAFAYESREEAPIDMARYDHTSFISAELSILSIPPRECAKTGQIEH